MTACDAITLASVARMTIGSKAQPGASRKKGFWIAACSRSRRAPCP